MHPWPITFSLPQGLTIGGLTSWAIRLTDHFLSRGRRVQWAIHEPLPGHAELPATTLPNAPGFTAVRLPALTNPTHWQECIAAYQKLLPTVILPAVHAESYGIAAALAATNAADLRVVAWNHSDNPYDYAYLTRYEPIIHRYIANTHTCMRELNRRIPTRARDILLIPHGVEVPALFKNRPAHCNRADTHSDPHRSSEEPRPIRIAYGGRIEQLVKRVLDLPRLANALDARGVRFELRIIGDGPQSAELDRRLAEANRAFRHRENKIQHLPPVPHDQMQEFWHWADVAVLMSAHEGLSVAMLEAMAAGCIPIVTAVESGARDVIVDGDNGHSFPIGDVEQAAEKIESLAGDGELRRRIATKATNTIRTRFAFEPFAAGVDRTLNAIQADSPRPWPLDRAPMPPRRITDEPSTVAGDTIPSDTPHKLRTLLTQLAEAEAGPIAIYGAGRHTRALAEVWADSQVEIVGVIDDDPSLEGRHLWGWPILAPGDAESLGANAIVISSWMHEDTIWKRRTEFESRGITVHRIHAAPADTPSSFESQGGAASEKPTVSTGPSDVACSRPEDNRKVELKTVDAVITLLVWDAHEATSRLLASLMAGIAQKADWRLFILDQGSAPQTRDLLRRFAATDRTRIHLHRLEGNIGYPAGHNLLHKIASERVESQYLVTLNSDLVFHETTWLDAMIHFMDEHPLVGIAGPTGVVYQRSPIERLGWCRVATPEESSSGRYDSISGSLCILRQSMIDAIGLFDESFTPGYFEDTDLAFRAVANGWPIALCPIDHGHHDLGPENSTSAIKRDELAAKYGNFQKRNRNLFVERWLTTDRAAGASQNLEAATKRLCVPTVKISHAL